MAGFVKFCDIYSESAKFEGESRVIPLLALDEHWQFLQSTASSGNFNPPPIGEKYSGDDGNTTFIQSS